MSFKISFEDRNLIPRSVQDGFTFLTWTGRRAYISGMKGEEKFRSGGRRISERRRIIHDQKIIRSHRSVLFGLLFLTALVPCSGGVTLYVDGSFRGLEAGTAARPFRTMAAALNRALSGDTVEVASGLYREHISMKAGVRLVSRKVGAAVLYGGADRSGGHPTVIGAGRGYAIVRRLAVDASLVQRVQPGRRRAAAGLCAARRVFRGYGGHNRFKPPIPGRRRAQPIPASPGPSRSTGRMDSRLCESPGVGKQSIIPRDRSLNSPFGIRPARPGPKNDYKGLS